MRLRAGSSCWGVTSRGNRWDASSPRPLAPEGCCEMKRLYVSPCRALINAIIAEAKRIGYREMRLDALPTTVEAISLYRKAGSVSIDPTMIRQLRARFS
jgi:GNAT superfamily N-acetyltransferase